jgi:HJR/Mrr/RecB family endonuclease
MVNRAKQKGTSFESLLVTYLTELGYDAERQVLKGSADQGDIRVRIPDSVGFNIEAKNVRSMSLGQWVDESVVEAENAGRPCVVVHKRIGKGQGADQFVSMRLADFLAWFVAHSPLSGEAQ